MAARVGWLLDGALSIHRGLGRQPAGVYRLATVATAHRSLGRQTAGVLATARVGRSLRDGMGGSVEFASSRAQPLAVAHISRWRRSCRSCKSGESDSLLQVKAIGLAGKFVPCQSRNARASF